MEEKERKDEGRRTVKIKNIILKNRKKEEEK